MAGDDDAEVRGANAGGGGTWAHGECDGDGKCAYGDRERVGRVDASGEGGEGREETGMREADDLHLLFLLTCIRIFSVQRFCWVFVSV